MIQLRRLRAALTIGLVWAATWAACGVIIGARRVQFSGPVTFSGATVIGVCGFVAGVGFAIALSRAERRRRVASLSSRRSALWGALDGMFASPLAAIFLAPIVASDAPFDVREFVPIVLVGAGIMGALGAASAAATVSIARRGIPAERPSLDERQRV